MKTLVWGVSLTAIVVAAYITWQSRDTRNVDRNPILTNEQSISLQNTELVDYKSNHIRWKIKATSAEIYEKRNLTLLNRISGTIFSKSSPESRTSISADSGEMDGNSKLMTVIGNVRIVFDNGQIIHADKLVIDQEKEIIYSRTDILVISNRDRIKASTMVYDIKTGVLTLTKPKAKLEIDS
ncbi:MAG: LPS export ABC transporter periplasmic protein LptC [Proteobacteria bacterium]|nr:LPS export ABC transporter periplasmic protein LptC [Pseudomonadota bacterium]